MSDLAACPNCNAELPPRARFCAQCGTRIAAAQPPAAGERRPVAILFADLAGFTHLSSGIDAEETHRLLGRFFEVVDAIVARTALGTSPLRSILSSRGASALAAAARGRADRSALRALVERAIELEQRAARPALEAAL